MEPSGLTSSPQANPVVATVKYSFTRFIAAFASLSISKSHELHVKVLSPKVKSFLIHPQQEQVLLDGYHWLTLWTLTFLSMACVKWYQHSFWIDGAILRLDFIPLILR